VPVTRTNTLYVFANPVVSYCVIVRFETITLYPANALRVNIYTGVVCPCSKMRGCSCFRAISVDGQYDVEYSKMISAFFYNDTSNTTVLFSDEYLHKFYRYAGSFLVHYSDIPKENTCYDRGESFTGAHMRSLRRTSRATPARRRGAPRGTTLAPPEVTQRDVASVAVRLSTVVLFLV
jgi:hypothetical protein